jgi:hypothetical protein
MKTLSAKLISQDSPFKDSETVALPRTEPQKEPGACTSFWVSTYVYIKSS